MDLTRTGLTRCRREEAAILGVEPIPLQRGRAQKSALGSLARHGGVQQAHHEQCALRGELGRESCLVQLPGMWPRRNEGERQQKRPGGSSAARRNATGSNSGEKLSS